MFFLLARLNLIYVFLLETITNFENGQAIARTLGFQLFHIALVVNHCRSIWALWNHNDYCFTLWLDNPQFVILKTIDLATCFEFFCIGIYALA